MRAGEIYLVKVVFSDHDLAADLDPAVIGDLQRDIFDDFGVARNVLARYAVAARDGSHESAVFVE